MGKSDRGMLMFGEDLADLGVDVTQSEYVEFLLRS